ncbi:MAG: hypothetical protein IPN65_01950 [Elusimicrobia bacterium]|jgi:hypothetical protein|nr:hypothetical protein [Elusimicrobiota bacterium]MBK7207945.1 hypothetical protein [Elusimicrobiota bacterium]MBK7544711.1 hypothetical protein [Elusimicrobiota bacterium]MBK7574243.1 hypothetical protein [Elusimicrobiota bacterium]MBK7688817.1 hypothetical protein [Elusimicrobiota bacterium]
MILFPNGKCPKCAGVVSFTDVLSIVTPFQCIYCACCGAMIFLKRKWRLTLIAFGLSVVVLFTGLTLVLYAGWSQFTAYMAAALFLILMEWVTTVHIIRHQGLVVRRES